MSTAQEAVGAPTAQSQEGSELHPCQCGDFADAVTGARLQCDGVTYRNFAPGHDARLKGFLIRVGREGHPVSHLGSKTTMTPVEAASRYGFAGMVDDGIKRRPKQRDVPMVTDAPPTPPTPTKAQPAVVSARVGRWTYEGQVRRIDGDLWFVYRDSRNNERRTQDYAEV